MAVTVVHKTEISCDGYGMNCSGPNKLSYDKPLSVAARLAARLGWSVSGEIVCPACTAARAR